MNDPVTLTVWRDTKTDPPDGEFEVLAQHECGEMDILPAAIVAERPSTYLVWTELPLPPGEGALTVNEFDHIIKGGIKGRYTDPDVLARLRAALDALH